ncbi:hypothetical protein FJT64_017092 [Amphibalanus amphitrite]|uniref:Uncharacterized protein n=1 Tax=Amphibalanus amphitrite TaxID=1232801 RepID=A0A6A4X1L2_AMPAM|nr:hypothetical protein FJT64_017092 [Amphibalanus amphitrite]
MIKDSLGTSEHRLAILVSGGPDHTGGKLLAVPTIADGTGLAQAEATATALDDWGVSDNVVGLCYDTTSSNTGRLKGAVVKLEAMLEKKLLRLECRHHVLELVLGAVSTALFGPTSGPLYRDLQRFRDVDQPVADAALAVLRRHTAYLQPQTVVLSLASDAVGEGERQALAEALLSQPESADPEDAALCLERHTQLADLVTDASWQLFQLLKLDPRSWLRQPAYVVARGADKALPPVRGVEFSPLLTPAVRRA